MFDHHINDELSLKKVIAVLSFQEVGLGTQEIDLIIKKKESV